MFSRRTLRVAVCLTATACLIAGSAPGQSAIDVTRRTGGVESVVNDVTIPPAESDQAIAQAMLKALRGYPHINAVSGTSAEKPLFIELPPAALPVDVSGAGFTVVGFLQGGSRWGGGFYWMPTTGVVPIGGNSAIAISADGRTIVGRALDEQGRENAAIWMGGTEWRTLGSFSPDAAQCDDLLSGSFGTSDDGRVVVGLGWDGCRFAHGFRWEESTGVVDLGSSVAERSSRANNVSGDGRVIVGWQDGPSGFRQGAMWVDGEQAVFVGPRGPVGEARAANSDGSLVVGQNCDPLEQGAWSWTAETGVVCHPFERPGRFSIAMMIDTSEDGRVIGGAHSFGPDSEAVLWIDGEPHFLRDYLRANGLPEAFDGWVNTGFITGVSSDGRVLVGWGAAFNAFQGYVVILPPRSGSQ